MERSGKGVLFVLAKNTGREVRQLSKGGEKKVCSRMLRKERITVHWHY